MRITVVRGFAAYLATLDPAAEVPPASLLPGGTRRAVPYLYSATDITALFTQAGRLRTPERTAAIQTLIGLLAVTGMRIGEALSLDDEDFDTAEGTLLVRHAKLGKHRLLPLHPTTVTAVQGYRRLRDQAFPPPGQPGAAGLQHRHPAAVLQRQPDVHQADATRGTGCPLRALPSPAA
jgi:integrase